jgi:hypothetical protein
VCVCVCVCVSVCVVCVYTYTSGQVALMANMATAAIHLMPDYKKVTVARKKSN